MRCVDTRSDLVELRTGFLPPVQDPTFRDLPLLELPALVLLLDDLDFAPDLRDQLPLLFGALGGGEQRCRDACSCGGEGAPRRPDVQRGDVAVADVLLMYRIEGRLPEREGNFDEAAVGGHRWALRARGRRQS